MRKPHFRKPSGAQIRFLEAYRRDPVIAPAARLAGVHRATIYRWMASAAFAAAMEEASTAFFREHKEKVEAEEAARQRWREERERERRAKRCENLASARAAKWQ